MGFIMGNTAVPVTGRLPDVYIIGAQKCGTTSLYDWIAQHPSVYGNPAAKDIPFFAMDDVYNRGPQYLANFSLRAPDDSLVLGGEVSAMFSPKAIARARELIPNAKLIVALRNPIDRAFSAWQFAVERGLEERTFDQVVEEEVSGVPYDDNVVNMAYMDYLARGKYAVQLEKLYLYFPREQVHIILFEEMLNDPSKIIRGVCNFLEVAEFVPEFAARNITQGGARFRWIQRLLYMPRKKNDAIAQLVRKLLPYRARFMVRNILEQFNRIPSARKQSLSPDIRLALAEYFSGDLKELTKLLNLEDEGAFAKFGWGR